MMKMVLTILGKTIQLVCDIQTRKENWLQSPSFLAVIMCIGVLLLGDPVVAQSYSTSTGMPSFSTPQSVELGFVDASSGNLHLSIPLGSYQQRGSSQPQNITLEYDSNFWVPIYNGSFNVWVPDGPNVSNGWYTSFPWVFSPVEPQFSGCQADIAWSDQNGTVHYFHVTTGAGIFNENYYATTCGGESNAFATDSSGYHMFVWNTGKSPTPSTYDGSVGFSVYAPDGTIADARCLGICPSDLQVDSEGNGKMGIDTNGNYSSGINNFTLTDTLGRKISGGDYAFDGAPGAQTIMVPNSQGTAQYQLTWAYIDVKTNFGQSGIYEFQAGYSSPWQLTVLKSITLPDASGSKYTFMYDCDPSDSNNTAGVCSSQRGQAAYYGQITSITLPTGGTVSYSYSTLPDVYGGKGRWVTSRTSSEGNWTYSGPHFNSSCTSTQLNCQQSSTVTSPTGVTVYTYQLNNGAWPISVVQKDPSGTLMSTTTSSFDFSQACVTKNCQGASFVRITGQENTIPSAGGNLKKQTTYAYDSPQHGNKTAVKEWAYIPSNSTYSAVPDRATYMSYLDYESVPGYTNTDTTTLSGGSNINRPLSKTVCNNSGSDSACPGGGTRVSQTVYSYDQYGANGLAAIAGVSQHDDASFGVTNTTRGNSTSISRWVNGTNYVTTGFSYDTTGQVLTQKDSFGNLTTYSYTDNFLTANGNGSALSTYNPPQTTNAYLTSATDSIGTYREGYYFGSGAEAVTTDYNNQSVFSYYEDGLGRKTEEIEPFGWKLAAYSSASRSDMYTVVGDASPSTACTSCQHTQTNVDVWGRITSQVLVNDPVGPVEVDNSYDSTGRLVAESHAYSGTGDPNNVAEGFSYDSLNRQTSTTHPDGQSQQVVFGPSIGQLGGVSTQQGLTSIYGYGYPQVSEDESGNKHQQWVDGFGRIVEVDEPSSSSGLTSSPYFTNYLYDAGNRLTKVIQGGQTRTFSYDGLGRKTSENTPEGGNVNYSYVTTAGTLCSGDPSNVCSRTDARGVVSVYTYDNSNRLTGVSYSIPSGQNIATMPNICTTSNGTAANVCKYYDQGGAAAYALGRLTKIVDATGSESYSFDRIGRTLQLSKIIGGQSFNIGYQYDAGGDITQITYPSGRVVQQAYNQIGQLCQIALLAADCNASSSYYAANFSYNSPGKLTGFSYGNGVSGAFYYSPDRTQLTYLAYTKGSATYFNLQYAYQQSSQYAPSCPHGTQGNNGSIQCIMDNVDPGRSLGYSYDQLQRLMTAKTCGSSTSPQWAITETYDRFGNRWSQTATAGSAPQPSLQFGINGQDSSTNNQPFNFAFDASGNMTMDVVGPSAMTYDAENEMTSYNGSSGNYTYDGNGFRVSKSGSATNTTVSIFSGSSVIAEYDSGAPANAPSREYIYNGAGDTTGLLAMVSGGDTTYYHQDHLGVRITTDTSGTVQHQQGTFPFGEIWYQTDPSNKFVFTTYDRDSESGLDYAQARYYDSRTGTFCSADPLAGSPSDPQSWNRYPYGRNDPVDVTDPSGKSWWSSLLIDIGIGLASYFLGPELGSLFPSVGFGDLISDGYDTASLGNYYTFFPNGLISGVTRAVTTSEVTAASSTSGSLGAALAGTAAAAAADHSSVQPNAKLRAVSLAPTPGKDCPPVPPHPKGADVNANIRATQAEFDEDPSGSGAGANWVNRVKTNGVWDYKTQPPGYRAYDDFGNFNYGATGAVFTNSFNVLAAGAVLARLKAAPWRQLKNYGLSNDAHKNEMIRQGMQYKQNDCGDF